MRPNSKKTDILKNTVKYVIIFIVIIIMLLVSKYIEFPYISGVSMNPSFYEGERAVAVVTNNVGIGDVVIIWSDNMQEYIIKRVVGVAGDTIEIKGGQLYRNGIKIYEDYILTQDWGKDTRYYLVTVPENEIFVLGDNRDNSIDSRILGTISIDDVKMKVISKLKIG